ncbi:MAG: TonB-dependent receptor [Calditrichia bacterium]
MKSFKYLFKILFSFLLMANAWASTSISGKVTDERTKEPLIGVNIVVLNSENGASTDENGIYRIENLPSGKYRLEFSYIGYTTVLKTDVVVTNSKPAILNVEMREGTIEGEEVTVTAGYFVEEKMTQSSTIGLSREEIRRFPGGFEDVVRTVSTLPGVAINASGGRNDPRYGDKMSSVLELKMTEGRNDRFGSKLLVSATQYGLNFEGPVTDRGNFIFSARQSYLDLIFKAAGLPFVPVYTDFNFLAHYDLSPRDKLFFLGLSAIDRVNRDQSSLENRVRNSALLDNTQNQIIAGINYRRLLNKGYLDVTVNSNLFQYKFSQLDQFEQEYFNSKADEYEYGLKIQHYWALSKSLGILSGISAKQIRNQNTTIFADTIYDRSGNRVPLSSLGIPPNTRTNSEAQKYASFVEFEWLASSKITMNLGLRGDYYSFIDEPFYLAPRIALKYRLTDPFSIRLSGGIYYQSPSYVWVVNQDNKRLKALQNQMVVLGFDYLLQNDFRISLETYYKRYLDLPTGVVPGVTDYIVITNTGIGYGGNEDDFQSFGYIDLVSEATGKAYGLELLFQKKFSEIPCYGQASFFLGKSEVIAFNGKTYPTQYDQRFIFNLSGGYIFNSNWEISAKFRYFTGVPYTPVYIPSQNPVNPGTIQNLPGEYLTSRLAAGHHLDIRADRYFNFKSWTLILYLDIQNIYNYKIPQRPVYDFWANEINTSSSIGILPSIGISAQF